MNGGGIMGALMALIARWGTAKARARLDEGEGEAHDERRAQRLVALESRARDVERRARGLGVGADLARAHTDRQRRLNDELARLEVATTRRRGGVPPGGEGRAWPG